MTLLRLLNGRQVLGRWGRVELSRPSLVQLCRARSAGPGETAALAQCLVVRTRCVCLSPRSCVGRQLARALEIIASLQNPRNSHVDKVAAIEVASYRQ